MDVEAIVDERTEQEIQQIIEGISYAVSMAATHSLYDSNRIKTLYNQYTPKKTGKLRKNTQTNISSEYIDGLGAAKLSIIYKQPYARYQYVNHFMNYTTPGTGGEWDKVAEGEVMDFLKRAYKKNVKYYMKNNPYFNK